MSERDFYADLIATRWPNGVRCPHCASDRFYDYRRLKLFRCASPVCRKNFSPTTKTVFQWRKLSPQQLLEALRLFPSMRSAHELGRTMGIEYKSAHYLWKRLRMTGGKLQSEEASNGKD